MIWEFFCNDGSPLGVVPQDVFGERGVGGAELALLSLAETLAEMGHSVTIYNNPRMPTKNTSVRFANKSAFKSPHKSDVFVLFRSPNPALMKSRANTKLFWTCDQYTTGDYTREIFPRVTKTVTISPFHTEHHIRRWKANPARIGHIDLGVRLEDYAEPLKKRLGQAIYCSVPGRGLTDLSIIWPMIVERMPDAHLVITSDFSLWGATPRNRQWRLKFARVPRVSYVGKIPRGRLIQEQLWSMVHLFPCVYDELFCISAAECQAAGAVPITTIKGALKTTNRWGLQIPGDPSTKGWRKKCVELALEGLSGGLEAEREAGIEGARREFDWKNIAQQWIDLVETGEFPSSKERGGSE